MCSISTRGQEFDYSTDFHYYESRYQDPWFGRFISPDTIVPDPLNTQDLNRYSYASNSPPNYIDPTGFCSVWRGPRDADSCWNGNSWRNWFRDTFGWNPPNRPIPTNPQNPVRDPFPIPDGTEEIEAPEVRVETTRPQVNWDGGFYGPSPIWDRGQRMLGDDAIDEPAFSPVDALSVAKGAAVGLSALFGAGIQIVGKEGAESSAKKQLRLRRKVFNIRLSTR